MYKSKVSEATQYSYDLMPKYKPVGGVRVLPVQEKPVDELDNILANIPRDSGSGIQREENRSSASASTSTSSGSTLSVGSVEDVILPVSSSQALLSATLSSPQEMQSTSTPISWTVKIDAKNPDTWIVQRQRHDRPGTVHQFRITSLENETLQPSGPLLTTLAEQLSNMDSKSVPKLDIENVSDSSSSIQSPPMSPGAPDIFSAVFPKYAEQLRFAVSKSKGSLCKVGWRCWETATPCGGAFIEVANQDGKRGSAKKENRQEMKFEHRDPIVISEENVGQFLICISFLNKCVPSLKAISSDLFLRSLDMYVNSGLKRHPFGLGIIKNNEDKYSEQYLGDNLDEKISRGVFIAATIYLQNTKVDELLADKKEHNLDVPVYLEVPRSERSGSSTPQRSHSFSAPSVVSPRKDSPKEKGLLRRLGIGK